MTLRGDPFSFILSNHFSRYPQLQVEDLYKLLHQAALGSEHANADADTARRYLLDEMEAMGGGPDEPLPDPIAPGGRMLRLHLRPWLKAGKDPEELLRLFIRTASDGGGSPHLMLSYGRIALQWIEKHPVPIGQEKLAEYLARMESAGFPPVHHSRVFTTLYRPAYRVVARKWMEEA